ncbi:MAG: response regulator [Bacteroidota bacterium]|nr:response regulator [Bacteroidota bacterium]
MHYLEILLVEDNPNDAEMTIRALKKHQLLNKIIHVYDGEEALDYIYKRGAYVNRSPSVYPKLIILDLKLPKVDGLQVLRTLKNDPDTKSIPVVVMTSSREEGDLIDSYKLGVNSFIVKPVGFQDFVKAVSDLGLYWMLLNEVSDTYPQT